MNASPDCRHARLHLGAQPHDVPPEVAAHVEGCADCRRFRDETLAMESRVQAALELPLARFRKPARARRFALAASVVFALVVAGGFWLLQPARALAGDVARHVEDEAESWDSNGPLPATQVDEVLRTAGAHFDSPYPVVYGYPCPFKGHRVAHLVLQTAHGAVTVMLIPHEHVRLRTKISRDGMSGVLLPAGKGTVALLTRDGKVPQDVADQVVSRVSW